MSREQSLGLAGLDAMLEEVAAGPPEVQPSGYWNYLNNLNLEQLAETGVGDFKRTINGNYFQWLPTGPSGPQFRAVLRYWLRRPSIAPWSARIPEKEPFLDSRVGNPLRTRRGRAGYALFVALLWELADREGARGVLEGLEEPALGNPLVVRHRGRAITQDLCNSALEYSAIAAVAGTSVGGQGTVIELGAGYGRLAWLFLKEHRDLRYVVVDIPPALAVAQEYLCSLFPDRAAFRFRRFARADEVGDEMDSARMVFLTPNQLGALQPLGASLFINVSSLHEMRPDQIAYSLGLVGRHTAGGLFYSKQSLRSVNPYDGLVIRRGDYPIPPTWDALFNRRHRVQTSFFEALYRIPGAAEP